MAISFVGASNFSATTVGSATPTLHASTTDGDLLLFILEHPNNLSGFPAGWETLCNLTSGSAGTGQGLWVGWRKYDSAGYVQSTVLSGGDHLAGCILTYRGVEVDEYCYDVLGTNTGASSTAVTFPSVTTTVNNTMIVNIMSTDTDASGTTRVSGWTNGNLGSLTERFDNSTVNGNGGGIAVADGTLATAGSSGSTTATIIAAAAQCLLTIALRESGTYSGYPSSPTVADTTTGGGTSNGLNHPITLPTGINSGDVLVAMQCFDATPAFTWDNTTAGTWTQRLNDVVGSSNRLVIYTKVADGTEDGAVLGITTTTSEAANWAVLRITGASGNVEITASTTQTTATPNPRPTNSLTPSWGVADTLWLGVIGRDDATSTGANKPPRWTSGASEANGGSLGASLGCLNYSYITENIATQSWGGISLTGSEQWISVLLGFEPAATSGDETANLGSGSLTITSLQPTITAGQTATTSTSAIAITGYAPTVSSSTTASPGVGSITITGQQPILSRRIVSWNPSDASLLGTGAGLSNSDLTVTTGDSTVHIRATHELIGGKFYWEINLGNYLPIHADRTAWGIKQIGGSVTSEANSALWFDGIFSVVGYNSGVWKYGSSTVDVDMEGINNLITTGDTLCFAYDAPNSLFWVRRNNTNWNNNGSANPATGVGGLDVSSLGATMMPYFACYDDDYVITANFGRTAFVHTAPSGFISPNLGNESISATANLGATQAITITGFAPTISSSVTSSPTTQAVVITGQVPTVSSSVVSSPTTQAIVITGQVPTLASSVVSSPTTQAIVITGQQPDVAVNYVAALDVGSVIITGQVPTVSSSVVSTPGFQTITISGNVPTVSDSDVATTGAPQAIVVTGYAPTVTSSVVSSPSTQAVVITGRVPTVESSTTAALATTQAITITGNAPTVTSSAVSSPTTQAIVITGYQPDVAVNYVAEAVTQSITISGNVPTFSSGTSLTTDAPQAIVITGHAPTVVASDALTAALGYSNITITGHQPSVSSSVNAEFLGPAWPEGVWDDDQPWVDNAYWNDNVEEWITISGRQVTTSISYTAELSYQQIVVTPHQISASSGADASPSTQSLIINGYPPSTGSTTNESAFFGATQALAISGFAPNFTSATTATLGSQAVVITGYQPDVAVNYVAAIGVGSVAITGDQPTVASSVTSAPGSQAIVITGHSITAQAGSASEAIIGVGALTITGQVPTVTSSAVSTSATQSIAIGGYAPSVAVNNDVQLGASTLSITGHQLSVAVNYERVLGATQAIAIDPYAPAIVANSNATLGAQSITVTGYPPIVTRSDTILIQVQTGEVVMFGYKPFSRLKGTLPTRRPKVAIVA